MIWLALYLAVGVALSIWLPIDRARTLAKLKTIGPEVRARMSPPVRTQFDQVITMASAPLATKHYVIAGLLWPLQIFGIIWGHVISARVRSDMQ